MRLRVRFQKLGKVRFTSHRDVARMWERACRRVRLPLAYTGGFSPRPKISFGLALPTGHESLAEYLDLDLLEEAAVDVAALPAAFSEALPSGVDATAVATIDDRASSLQEEVTCCTWRLHVDAPADDIRALVTRTLEAQALPLERERKGGLSVDDVRPAILELEAAIFGPDQTQLEAILATQPRGLRPLELLRTLDPALEAARVIRINQWIERDGARREPLSLVPADAMRREHDVRPRFGVPGGLPPDTQPVPTAGVAGL
jgi:radical SAM-linked protein